MMVATQSQAVMRIALCSPCAANGISKSLGATKNRLELAEHLGELGWRTTILGTDDIGISRNGKVQKQEYATALRDYLVANAEDFDVVLYEYDTLPFDRALFSNKTLFVARPALLEYHLQNVKFRYDARTKVKIKIRKIWNGLLKDQDDSRNWTATNSDISLSNSDVIQVQNSIDAELLRSKFPQKNIIVIPNGIDSHRYIDFAGKVREHSAMGFAPTIAFVGTFDFRKGAVDIVEIATALKKRHPYFKLKLLGTKGLFQTKQSVFMFFPPHLRTNLVVVPEFIPDELPLLLSDCHFGIFPSYFESFGFGALEMMCSGLPVIGYSSPGPADFLIKDLLVDVGDVSRMISVIFMLLSDPSALSFYSIEARKISSRYLWADIAKSADQAYKTSLQRLRSSLDLC